MGEGQSHGPREAAATPGTRLRRGGEVRVLAGPRWKDVRAGRSAAATRTGNAESPSGDSGVTSPGALATPGGRARRQLGLGNVVYEAGRPRAQPPPRSPRHCGPHRTFLKPELGTRRAGGWRNPAPEKQRESQPAEDLGRSPEGRGPLTGLGSAGPAVGRSVRL